MLLSELIDYVQIGLGIVAGAVVIAALVVLWLVILAE